MSQAAVSCFKVEPGCTRLGQEVIDFLLHVNKRDAGGLKGWKSNLFLEKKPVSIIAMTKASAAIVLESLQQWCLHPHRSSA